MKRVLYIDDDILALQLMAKISRLLGFQVITSSSAYRGLTIALRENPDVVLVDLHMDEMDGSDFIRQLRRLPGLDRTPVYIYTIGAGQMDAERARQSGADGIYNKPLNMNELSQIIHLYSLA